MKLNEARKLPRRNAQNTKVRLYSAFSLRSLRSFVANSFSLATPPPWASAPWPCNRSQSCILKKILTADFADFTDGKVFIRAIRAIRGSIHIGCGSAALHRCTKVPLYQCVLGLLLLASPLAQAQFTWTTNGDNTITITGYTGPGGDVAIPDTITGLPVTSIGDSAFYGNSFLSSVTIANSVTEIGVEAFDGCNGLTNVSIPGSVGIIGFSAFDQCSNLNRASISEGVTNIDIWSFRGCATLTSVTIPSSLTFIGQDAFSRCPNLSVFFKGNAPTFVPIEQSGPQTIFGPGSHQRPYYLPGAGGWYDDFSNPNATLFGAILWNPLIQTGDGGFGVQNGQFGFNITGTADIPIAVEPCTNLANPVWTPLATMTLTNGSVYFSEPVQTNTPARFYRIGSP